MTVKGDTIKTKNSARLYDGVPKPNKKEAKAYFVYKKHNFVEKLFLNLNIYVDINSNLV